MVTYSPMAHLSQRLCALTYPAGRTHASRLKGKVSTGLLVRITPSKDAVKRHIKDLNETVRQMRTAVCLLG